MRGFSPPKTPKQRQRKLLVLLGLWAVAMFGFGYALVPMYDVMCKKLGINGKTSEMVSPLSPVAAVDLSRTVTVQFLTVNNAYLPWKFYPYRSSVVIHPGENTRIAFFAKNESDHTMTVQAIPSIAPGEAAKFLKKTECFCFKQQTLQSHQAMDMPVLFHIERDLPKDIHTITLAYTLFDTAGLKKPLPDPHVVEGRILAR